MKLVQDHERCLWQERNLKALREAGCPAIARFPKHSPDLNAIEGWWKKLRERLQETEPVAMESRDKFLGRLRRVVIWLKEHAAHEGKVLCTNQKVRAADVKQLEGAKTKW